MKTQMTIAKIAEAKLFKFYCRIPAGGNCSIANCTLGEFKCQRGLDFEVIPDSKMYRNRNCFWTVNSITLNGIDLRLEWWASNPWNWHLMSIPTGTLTFTNNKLYLCQVDGSSCIRNFYLTLKIKKFIGWWVTIINRQNKVQLQNWVWTALQYEPLQSKIFSVWMQKGYGHMGEVWY